MPSGRVHALTTTFTAAIISPVLVIVAAQPVESAVAFAAGCMAGLLITPDLDVDHRTKSYTVVRRSFGWLIAQRLALPLRREAQRSGAASGASACY